jgi:purine-binding chemotaxis protein CheW
MDILAARKKAAEKARSRQNSEPAQPPEPPHSAITEAPRTEEPASAAAGSVPAPQPVDATTPAADGAAGGTEPDSPEDAIEPAIIEEMELLSFRLGGEEYAVKVDDVREVLKIRELTLVPNAPDYILGVMSLRGAMLPVIDLCRRLGITQAARDEKTRILVVSPDEEDVGLMVDRVSGVLKVTPDAIKPVPENIEHGAEFLRGIVRKEDRLYILLDLMKAVGG